MLRRLLPAVTVLRHVGTTAAGVGVAVSAGTLASIAAGVTPLSVVAAAQGASGVAAGSAAVAGVAAAAAGRRRLAVGAGVVLLLWVAYLFGIQRTERAGRSTAEGLLSVGSANLLFENPDPIRAVDSVLQTVRERNLQVLVTAETTEEMLQLIDSRIGEEWVRAAASGYGGLQTAVWTRLPVIAVDDLAFGRRRFPVVVVDADGEQVRIVGVHVTAPHDRRRIPIWKAELDGLAATVSNDRSGSRFTVLAGDFNADVTHPAMRRLNRVTFDAVRATGRTTVRTWPAERMFPPVLTLDHVLSSDAATVKAAGVFPIVGSDHLGVWATLTRPST